MTAAHLIYPLRSEQDRLGRQLRRCTLGKPAGRLLVETIRSLERAERLARELTPFNPTGL